MQGSLWVGCVVMTAFQTVPQIPGELLSLVDEATSAISASYDINRFGGVALFDERKDSLFTTLPSYPAAKAIICETALVEERYGSPEAVGDRLTLQFIYQLFPRPDQRKVREDARRLWRDFWWN
jgi:hypothetical protein